jgi:hypothetical protein
MVMYLQIVIANGWPVHLTHTLHLLCMSTFCPGIPWLIEKFKQYVVLRDRLFSDTSVLRGKLQDAIPGGWLPGLPGSGRHA